MSEQFRVQENPPLYLRLTEIESKDGGPLYKTEVVIFPLSEGTVLYTIQADEP